MGLICRRTDRATAAIEYFATATRLDPFFWAAFEQLCVLGADDHAATCFHQSRRAPPALPTAPLHLLRLCPLGPLLFFFFAHPSLRPLMPEPPNTHTHAHIAAPQSRSLSTLLTAGAIAEVQQQTFSTPPRPRGVAAHQDAPSTRAAPLAHAPPSAYVTSPPAVRWAPQGPPLRPRSRCLSAPALAPGDW